MLGRGETPPTTASPPAAETTQVWLVVGGWGGAGDGWFDVFFTGGITSLVFWTNVYNFHQFSINTYMF